MALLLRILLLLAIGTVASAQHAYTFRSLGGPFEDENLSVVVMATAPGGTIHAGSYNKGVLRSSDDGATWTGSRRQLQFGFVTALAIDSGGVVYAGNPRGIFRSDDDGINWFPLREPAAMRPVTSLAATADAIWASTGRDSIVVSTDRGASWMTVWSGRAGGSVRLLALPSGEVLAGTRNGLFRTDLSGRWDSIPIAAPSSNITMLTTGQQGEILLGVDRAGLFRSTDMGESWRPIGLDGKLVLAAARSTEGILVASVAAENGERDSLLRSTDDGTTWNPVRRFWQIGSIAMLTADGHGRIYASGYQDSLFISTPMVDSFTSVGRSFAFTRNIVGIGGGDLLVSTYTGLHLYESASSRWTALDITRYIGGIGRDSSGNLFATTSEGVYRSGDRGATWQRVSDRLFEGITVAGDGSYHAGHESFLYRSSDNGATWTATQIDSFPYTLMALEVIAKSPWGMLYAMGRNSVFRSSDHGKSWKKIEDGGQRFLTNMTFLGDRMVVIGSEKAIHISSDRGDSWTQAGSPEPDYPPTASAYFLVTAYREDLLAVTDSGGVYRSVDSGATWSRETRGIASRRFRSPLAVVDGRLYANTDAGVYAAFDTLLIARRDSPIDSERAIVAIDRIQGESRLRLHLPSEGSFRLELFDIQGIRRLELIDRSDLPGEYHHRLDIDRFRAGLYLWRLTISGRSTTGAVMVMH